MSAWTPARATWASCSPGAAADADGADGLPVDHDRHAAVERGDFSAAGLGGILQADVEKRVSGVRAGSEGPARLAKGRRRGRLGDGRVEARRPRTVHSLKSDQMAAVIDRPRC